MCSDTRDNGIALKSPEVELQWEKGAIQVPHVHPLPARCHRSFDGKPGPISGKYAVNHTDG